MSEKHKKRSIGISIRNRIVSGILLLLPFAVTYLIVRWLFLFLFKYLKPIVVRILEEVGRIPTVGSANPLAVSIVVTVLAILMLVFFFYLVGSVGRWVIVRRFVEAGEAILLKIPLVRTVYSATQQVAKAVSLPGKESFKSVGLVEFPRPGIKAVGFITGYVTDTAGAKYAKVFIPTAPNPTTGFFEMVPIQEIVETDMTIESAFTMIISGGLVTPEGFQIQSPSRSAHHVQV